MVSNQEKIKIIKLLAEKKIESGEDLADLKRELSKKFKIPTLSNVEILEIYRTLRAKKQIKKNLFFEKGLKKRPVRSLSGVAVVSVLTKPYPCPGRCLYCPLEPGIPKSYLSGEPAVERAKALRFDPFLQVKKRIEVLEKIGHPTDKIELIVIGGTWSYFPPQYQTWFVKRCFQAANAAEAQNSKFKAQNLTSKPKTQNLTLEKLQTINETAKHRIVGLTLETRPDYITTQEILRIRKLGCTKVEIGVQAIDDKILKINQRGHKVKEIIQATKLLKKAGFKVCYHLMPGLPGSNLKKDFQMFKKIFTDPDFQPDLIKIYPCVVTRGSALYKLFKNGKYKPYSDQQLINLLVKIKKIVPSYVRIIRIFRDIPSKKIYAGSKISNLREVVQKELKKRELKCNCIRCREIKNLKYKIENIKLIKREYFASMGKEIFLSFEDIKNDKLLAFSRLRLPTNYSNVQYFPELKNSAIIRELHTYGQLVPISKKSEAVQHLGLGKKLVKEAEKIVQNSGFKKIAVISGVGARLYWRKLGYRLQDTYMVKNFYRLHPAKLK